MTACARIDRETGLHCIQEEGHDGLCCAPIPFDDEGRLRLWGTITIPGEILDKWQAEADEEARRGD